MLDRRRLLKGLAAGAVAAAASPILLPRKNAYAWGERPATPFSDAPYKVLEIFLYGGLSPWENFHVREDGRYADWFSYKSRFDALSWCPSVPGMGRLPFGTDRAGNAMFLGASTAPLWDLASRLRVLPVRHNLGPHEAAIPYALTGLRLGNARLAGLGAHIQRFSQEAIPLSTPLPRSYVVFPPSYAVADESRLVAMTATGTHPGSARPLFLRLGDGAQFVTALERSNVGFQHDRLLDAYRDQYRRALRWGGPDVDGMVRNDHLTRSPAFGAYNAAVEGVLHAQDLRGVFTPGALTPAPGSGCGRIGAAPHAGTDFTGRGIALAGHLFANGARYVGVVDVGLVRAGTGGGYDTHPEAEHARLTAFNLQATLASLRAAIGAGINLDETLVVLNTEFGRTPDVGREGGRDHHPEGYVMALLGGPIGRNVGGVARANRGVGGAMDGDGLALERHPTTGVPIGLTPTDVLGGVLLAAGINPRANEVYGVGDFSEAIASSGGGDDADTARRLAATVLGISGVL